MLWEEQFPNQEYTIGGLDMKRAKELLEVNDWSSEEMEIRLKANSPQYFADQYWGQKHWPASGFFYQFTVFNPKTKAQESRRKYYCAECLMNHFEGEHVALG